jgi:hypothetical protein
VSTTPEPHACPNCEGVDPDTCFMNANRPPEQCPNSEFDGYGSQCQKEAGHNLCSFEVEQHSAPTPPDATLPDRIDQGDQLARRQHLADLMVRIGRGRAGADVATVLASLVAAEQADATERAETAEAERDAARATNQRLNYRAQTAESRLNAVTTAVANWRINDQHTYVPLSSLNAIAKAVGITVAPDRWELHGEHVQKLEAALARVRDLVADMQGVTGARWWADQLTTALTPPVPADGPEGGAQ